MAFENEYMMFYDKEIWFILQMIYYKQVQKANSETLIILRKMQLFAYNIMSILLML
jgi:hypothetical protein